MRIDVTAVKYRRWSRSSRFFFLFLLLLSLSFVSVQRGKEICQGISGSGSHRRIRTSITSLLVASVTWGRISSIGGSLITSSVRLSWISGPISSSVRLSWVSGPITSTILNLVSLSVPTAILGRGWRWVVSITSTVRGILFSTILSLVSLSVSTVVLGLRVS